MTRIARGDLGVAALVAIGLVIAYNSNGREIGSYDSQPNKYAARELILRHTLTLNHTVGAMPALAERPSFVLDRHGRYRSAYSPVTPLLAAAISWPLWKAGVLDVRAPLAPGVIAVLGASTLTALSVAFAYLVAVQRLDRRRALLLAVGLGLGTGLWSAVSQTLWVHETAIFGLSIAMLAFAAPVARLGPGATAVVGTGLALAGMARPQVGVAIAVLLVALFLRARRAHALVACAIVACGAVAIAVVNVRWFGHPLGGVVIVQAGSATIHGTDSAFQFGPDGFIGLLASPNRGLLIFSPVVAVALLGVRAAVIDGWRSPLPWCGLAALAQYGFYSCYSVWWAGHTYGPRYLLDVLPLLVPLAAAALSRIRINSVTAAVGAIALLWSIAVAGTGAFCYPNDAWNTDPTDVDRDHARLWSWSDMQVVRCWRRGPSPQNFQLFARDAFRVEGPH
jgi:hypothetical protein